MSASTAILVIDEEQGSRDGLVHDLLARGFDASGVSDHTHALESVRSKPVDVVLLDMERTGLLGPHTIRAIKDARPTAELIVTSSNGVLESLTEQVGDLVLHFVPKPVPVEVLMHFFLGTPSFVRWKPLPVGQTLQRLTHPIHGPHRAKGMLEDVLEVWEGLVQPSQPVQLRYQADQKAQPMEVAQVARCAARGQDLAQLVPYPLGGGLGDQL